MNVAELNRMPEAGALELLTRCCGSSAWVDAMMASRPFPTDVELLRHAESIWFGLSEKDWLEAFSHHPKIGDVSALKTKFANTAQWASGEQAGTSKADDQTLSKLHLANVAYEQKFGFIFIICATGKSAAEMLMNLENRLGNNRSTELNNAAKEQAKITKLRLEKAL